MANVAVEFLVENLMQLLRDNAELILGVKEAAESLLQDLNDFNAFLKQAAKCRNENDVLKELVKKIRTVVNSAEDAIDKFVIEAKLHKDKGVTRVLDLPHYKRVREVAGEIKAIRNKVREIRQNNAIGLQALQDEDLSARSVEERKVSHEILYVHCLSLQSNSNSLANNFFCASLHASLLMKD